MFDFIESLLQKFTAPSVEYRSNYLPPLVITKKMGLNFDKEYLNFAASLFLEVQKSGGVGRENQLWFADEIARALRQCYPNLNMREYGVILQKLIDKENS